MTDKLFIKDSYGNATMDVNVFHKRLHEAKQFVKWYNEHSEVRAKLGCNEAELIAQAKKMGITINDEFKHYINHVLVEKAKIMFKDYISEKSSRTANV